MNPKWLPRTFDTKLARLIEECGEVLQEVGKIGRFGLDTRYCFKRHRVVKDRKVESNREALIRECLDLQHASTAMLQELYRGP